MSLRRYYVGLSCRKDLILIEEADKSGEPFKESILSKDKAVSFGSMQITSLPGG